MVVWMRLGLLGLAGCSNLGKEAQFLANSAASPDVSPQGAQQPMGEGQAKSRPIPTVVDPGLGQGKPGAEPPRCASKCASGPRPPVQFNLPTHPPPLGCTLRAYPSQGVPGAPVNLILVTSSSASGDVVKIGSTILPSSAGGALLAHLPPQGAAKFSGSITRNGSTATCAVQVEQISDPCGGFSQNAAATGQAISLLGRQIGNANQMDALSRLKSQSGYSVFPGVKSAVLSPEAAGSQPSLEELCTLVNPAWSADTGCRYTSVSVDLATSPVYLVTESSDAASPGAWVITAPTLGLGGLEAVRDSAGSLVILAGSPNYAQRKVMVGPPGSCPAEGGLEAPQSEGGPSLAGEVNSSLGAIIGTSFGDLPNALVIPANKVSGTVGWVNYTFEVPFFTEVDPSPPPAAGSAPHAAASKE